jgi:hypothetical protein
MIFSVSRHISGPTCSFLIFHLFSKFLVIFYVLQCLCFIFYIF